MIRDCQSLIKIGDSIMYIVEIDGRTENQKVEFVMTAYKRMTRK